MTSKESDVSELRDALAECDGSEINPSNYGHDDVCNLNERYCAAFQVAERAIELLATLSPPLPSPGVERQDAIANLRHSLEYWNREAAVWLSHDPRGDPTHWIQRCLEHGRRHLAEFAALSALPLDGGGCASLSLTPSGIGEEGAA